MLGRPYPESVGLPTAGVMKARHQEHQEGTLCPTSGQGPRGLDFTLTPVTDIHEILANMPLPLCASMPPACSMKYVDLIHNARELHGRASESKQEKGQVRGEASLSSVL